MNEAFEVRSETLKLERLLQREPGELAYLDQVPVDDLRALRELATERLFAAHDNSLSRLATASKLIPPAVTATIAQRAFGPLLSARITGLLDPDRAVEIAAKLPSPFLADIAIDLDPRRASDVIGRIPARQIAEITAELVGRGEYVTMGRFVGHIGPDALGAAVDAMSDPDLLHVASVLEQRGGLDGLIDQLGPTRLSGVLDAAADEGLWPEALDVLANLSDSRKVELANVAAADDRLIDSLLTAAAVNELWAEVLPLVALLADGVRQRIVETAALRLTGADQAVLEALAAAIVEHDLIDDAREIVTQLGERELSILQARLGPLGEALA